MVAMGCKQDMKWVTYDGHKIWHLAGWWRTCEESASFSFNQLDDANFVGRRETQFIVISQQINANARRIGHRNYEILYWTVMYHQ